MEGTSGKVGHFSGVVEVSHISFCEAGSINRRELWNTDTFWSAALKELQVNGHLFDFMCFEFLFKLLHFFLFGVVQVV